MEIDIANNILQQREDEKKERRLEKRTKRLIRNIELSTTTSNEIISRLNSIVPDVAAWAEEAELEYELAHPQYETFELDELGLPKPKTPNYEYIAVRIILRHPNLCFAYGRPYENREFYEKNIKTLIFLNGGKHKWISRETAMLVWAALEQFAPVYNRDVIGISDNYYWDRKAGKMNRFDRDLVDYD